MKRKPSSTLSADRDDPGRSTVAVGLCRDCNYSLRGLQSNRCPECSRPFDPHDLASMNIGLPLGGFARWALSPCRWPILVLPALGCLSLLWHARLPSPYYMGVGLFLLFLLWLTALGLWMARIVLRVAVARFRRQPLVPLRLGGRYFWMLCLMLTFMSLLVEFKVPLRLGFLLARPELERLVAEIGGSAISTLPADRRAGLYTIDKRLGRRVDGALLFFLTEDGEAGLIYSPKREPEGYYNAGNRGHLWGPWYWCKED